MLFTAFDQGVRHFSSCWIFFAKAFASSKSCFAMLLTEKGFKHQLNSYINAVHGALVSQEPGGHPAEKLPLHFLSLRLCLPWLFRVARHSRILAAGDHHQTQTGVCCSHYPLDAGKHTCWDTWISNTTLVDKPCQARGNSRSLQRAEQK